MPHSATASDSPPSQLSAISMRRLERPGAAPRHATPRPFFLVIDDGGRPYLDEDGTKRRVGLPNYELVRDLAQEFNTCIPIAYTFRYLDSRNVSGLGGALPYVDELVAFIREQVTRLPLYHHGLTHGFTYVRGTEDWPTTHAEFYDLDNGRAIDETKQAWALDKCMCICDDQELPRPVSFVPPCHAWEPRVTDRLLRGCGIRNLICVPTLRFGGRSYTFAESEHLTVLPRKSLAISHDMTDAVLNGARLSCALAEVLPMSLSTRLRHYRRFSNPWVHSYYAHITNFFPLTRDFWRRFFDEVCRRDDVVIVTSEVDAEQKFLAGLSS